MSSSFEVTSSLQLPRIEYGVNCVALLGQSWLGWGYPIIPKLEYLTTEFSRGVKFMFSQILHWIHVISSVAFPHPSLNWTGENTGEAVCYFMTFWGLGKFGFSENHILHCHFCFFGKPEIIYFKALRPQNVILMAREVAHILPGPQSTLWTWLEHISSHIWRG